MSLNNNFNEVDHFWMQHAIELANQAAKASEVPVGAVIVRNQELIGSGYNKPITNNDPSAHAEIVAIREAARKVNNYRLVDTTLYVTLEPCAMCASAMLHARISRVVFGAVDPKAGAIGGAINLFTAHTWNHKIKAEGGLLAEPCGAILRDFFQQRR